MKRCPYCGMSNASTNSVCLSCWERLDEVKEEPNLGPMYPHVNYGNPLLNADARIMQRVLESKHDPKLKPSSFLLMGVFTTLLLAMGGLYDWAIIALLGSIVAAGFFHYYRASARKY